MGLDSIADFATEAFDVASETLSDGFEYLSDGFDQLQEQVGSFAGDSDWFSTNNFGSILQNPPIPGELGDIANPTALGKLFDSIPSVSDFSLPSISTNFPSLSSIIDKVPSANSLFDSAVTQVKSSAIRTASSLATQIPGGSTAIGFINGGGNLSSIDFGGIASSAAGSIANTAIRTVSNTVTGAVTGLVATGTAIATGAIRTAAGLIPSASAATLPNVGRILTSSVTVTGAPSIYNNATPIPIPPSQVDRTAANVGYSTVLNEENGTYSVVNDQTGEAIASGLSEQQAILQAQDQTFVDAGGAPTPVNTTSTAVDYTAPTAVSGGGLTVAYDDEGNLLPGYTLNENNDPVFVGNGFVEPATQALADAARASALAAQAQAQQTVRLQRQNQAQAGDWRVRLRLAPNSNYLYNAPDCGQVLWPLRNTDGVIFPYTPSIDTAYKANYSSYDLTHSNYRGYFYQNSYVEAINVKATFTAQDTAEANYLLAVIHFFRSVTKMFYGQDSERGTPPPLTYLSGLGDFQFNDHPCVVSQFNYNLPSDVNYIRAQSVLQNGTNLLNARQRQTVLGNPLSYAIQRLSALGQGILPGALDAPFAPQGSLGAKNPTYVPTKMEITLTLLPIQSRNQVSKQFSLKGFANGNLLRGGFW